MTNRRWPVVAGLVVALLVSVLSLSIASAENDNGIPARLSQIEALLKTLVDAVTPGPPTVQNTTRLLFPFVTNTAGFDSGLSVANTGRDSTGTVGRAGSCTIHYFGTVGVGAAPAPQTTSTPIPVGGLLTFVLSSGGNFGIAGTPNFQGYLEIVCDFPFAHGYGLLTDGPIGQARVGASLPVLVLPVKRSNAAEESLGH